jgi:hypothetical protein
MSSIPPVAKPMTGVPQARLSLTVWPKDSWIEGMTNTSAAL